MKLLFYFCACMYLMVGFTACSDDDETSPTPTFPKPGEEGYVETMPVTDFDQMEYLQNNLVEIDSVGHFIQRVNGVPLDPADTTVISIGVESAAEAKDIFKGWLSPNAEMLENGDIVTVDLKDEEKHYQGQVVFSPVTRTGMIPVIAEVTFSDDTDIKYVSKVEFIPISSWPNNGTTPYYFGDKVSLETYDEDIQPWVCVREYKAGQNGLLVYLSHSKDRWGAAWIKNFASVSLAKEVAKITKNNWNALVPIFKNAGMTLADDYYWIDDWKYYVFGGIYSINLKTEHIDWWEIVWKNPEYSYMQVQTFGELN